MTETWTGWVRLFGHWHRLTAGHASMSEARRALDAEVRHRRICIAPVWLRLTTGAKPRDS